MKLKVLGCSGGIGGRLRTTSMLLDDDVLIDGGTGVGDLEIEALAKIDHIFVTHSHMDHVAFIPLLVDTVGCMRDKPVMLHATAPTLAILREHLFNWKLWPDFTQIPDSSAPYLKFDAIEVGRTVDLGGRRITALPAQHVVPAVGFQLDGGRASLVFTGDTTANGLLWEAVNKIGNLRYLVIETAFSNSERTLAVASKHLCPSML
ncbi:MAG TPA: 3',5'-cyclic-nucleotide phosphodiesterase, partial [Burkholderiales bacterium]|nr:3',5'-cyclic-nucleotide phosphodiesterase [Burkholderiales bacterium]